jgi:hypothetical protein
MELVCRSYPEGIWCIGRAIGREELQASCTTWSIFIDSRLPNWGTDLLEYAGLNGVQRECVARRSKRPGERERERERERRLVGM